MQQPGEAGDRDAGEHVRRADREPVAHRGVTSQNISRAWTAMAAAASARVMTRPGRRVASPARLATTPEAMARLRPVQPPRAEYHATSAGRFADQTISACRKCM